MRRLFQPVRFFTILFSILVFLSHMGVVYIVVRRRWPRVRWSNRILSYYSRWGLWVLGVKVNPVGYENALAHPEALLVGNHLSYLDVLVLSSRLPLGFVTSMEIRETPGLGLICEMAGCLFVERRNKGNLRGEVAELSEGLKSGLRVAIFPEATSTNGEAILRFRRPLYMSAVEAQRPVIPFCLNYEKVAGERIGIHNRDSVFWYGDMDFIPHLWALAGSGGVEVKLHFLPPMNTVENPDPSVLAEASQLAVVSVFKPIS